MGLHEILRFEAARYGRSALFWACALAFSALAFAAVTTDAVHLGGAIGNVNRNSPFVTAQLLLVMTSIGTLASAAFAVDGALRDRALRTGELIFSTPISPRAYLAGRVIAAIGAALAIQALVTLAILLGAFAPWIDPVRLGSVELASYVRAFVLIAVPNVVIAAGLMFALAILSRSVATTYAGVLLLLVGYGAGAAVSSSLKLRWMGAYLDPFGLSAFHTLTRYWPSLERNTRSIGLEGPLLLGRLFWVGIALACLAIAFRRFSFSALVAPVSGGAPRAEESPEAAREGTSGAASTLTGPVPGRATAREQLVAHARAELRAVFRGIPFWVMLLLGVVNIVAGSLFIDEIFGTPVYPRSYLLVEVVRNGFELYALALITFYAGELAWRERSARADETIDACAAPGFVLWGAKLVALAAVCAVLVLAAAATAVAIQLIRQYTEFQPVVYAAGLAPLFARLVLIAVLALFAQAVTGHRQLGYLLMVLYFVSGPAFGALGLDHHLFRYASAPGAPYSDMNGYGPFLRPLAWFLAHWLAAAGLLIVLVHALWPRGVETRLRERIRMGARRLKGGRARAVALGCGVVYVGTGAIILYNTNFLNQYETRREVEATLARYEQRYKRFEDLPMPRITRADVRVDLWPERRAADIRGTYRLRNVWNERVSHILLSVEPGARISRLEIAGAALESDDPESGSRVYRLTRPLAPGEEIDARFEVSVRNRGFSNEGAKTQIVENGTFFSNAHYLPHVGYAQRRELDGEDARRRAGLPPAQRVALLEERTAYDRNYAGGHADFIELRSVVSTSADQIALAPGELVRRWEQGGRRYFEYATRTPVIAGWAYLSGRYEVARAKWGEIDIEVYHHPGHRYNVDRMIDAARRTLEYSTRAYGRYPARHLRIVEFPRYARFAQSFPGLIPFSESVGFIARLDSPDDVDYVTYVTAHEVAHQWWGNQVIGADVQGATMLSETLAEYTALMVMERRYGRDHMRRFLKHALDSYLSGRGEETRQEVPLYRVENQSYIHYARGGLAMYALRDQVGEDSVNGALRRFLTRYAYRVRPYPTSLDLLAEIERTIPGRRQLLDDLIRTVTLWDLRALHAGSAPHPAGGTRVDLRLSARKIRVDSTGAERAVPIAEEVTVAVFGARTPQSPPEGEILAWERRVLGPADTVITIHVPRGVPLRAGVDPFNILIDRNPEDNTVRIGAR